MCQTGPAMNAQELFLTVTAAQLLLLALGWWFVNRRLHTEQATTLQMAQSSLLLAIALAAMAMRGEHAGAALLVVADVFQLLGVATLVGAVLSFWGMADARRWIGVIVVVGVLASVWFAFVQPNLALQATAAQFACAILVVLALSRVFGPMSKEFGLPLALALAFVGIASVAVMLRRAVFALGTSDVAALDGITSFSPSVLAVLSFVMVLPTVILGALTASRLLLQAEQSARTDGLTRVLSYASFMRESARLWDERKRDGVLGAMLYVDIDNFKQINTKHGQWAGDQVLQQIAAMLRLHSEGDVLIGRIGGDRFAMIQSPATIASATRLAHRLVRRAAGAQWVIEESPRKSESLTLSVGVAFDKSTDGTSSAVLRRAQDAASDAAQQGGSRIVIG